MVILKFSLNWFFFLFIMLINKIVFCCKVQRVHIDSIIFKHPNYLFFRVHPTF